MNGFSRTFDRPGAPLHVAAHSHHPWPDVSYEAQIAAWDDAARFLDRKWEHVFENVIPTAQRYVASQLGLPDPATIAFGPNTHGFVLRLLSCLPLHRPARILTTGSEFMSFARQIPRLEEDGLVEVTRVSTEPFADFEQRFQQAVRKGEFDLVFFSQVFFDSGFAIRDLSAIVSAVTNRETLVAIDGYHGFMARPTDLGAIAERAFYLAGGYKYAMAGEGVCFIHCPPDYGARPRDTGWYAGFDALGSSGSGISYANNGARFFGATFDVSGLYRFNAVQSWLEREELTVSSMLAHIRNIEEVFLGSLSATPHSIEPSMTMVPDVERRGRFLAFRTPDAAEIVRRLAAQGVIADHRGDRLRIGFGIYHAENDLLRLAAALRC